MDRLPVTGSLSIQYLWAAKTDWMKLLQPCRCQRPWIFLIQVVVVHFYTYCLLHNLYIKMFVIGLQRYKIFTVKSISQYYTIVIINKEPQRYANTRFFWVE